MAKAKLKGKASLEKKVHGVCVCVCVWGGGGGMCMCVLEGVGQVVALFPG